MKILLTVLFCVSSLLLRSQSLESYLSNGYSKIEAKDYKSAISSFNSARDMVRYTTERLTAAKIYLGLAIAKNGLKNSKQAISDLGIAIEIKPSFATLYMVRAEFYADNKKYDAAVRDIDTFLTYKPENPQAMTAKARYLIKAKNYTAAKDICSKMIEINPNNYHEYALFAEVYKSEKKYDSALYMVNRGLQIEPSNGALYSTRAYIHYYMKNYPECEKDNLKAMEVDKDMKEVSYNNLAFCYDAPTKKWDKMVEDCNKAIGAIPELSSYAYSNRGYAKLMLNKLEEGKADLLFAQKMNPENSYVLYYMAIYYQLTGKPKKGCPLLEKAIQQDMDDEIVEMSQNLQKRLECKK